MILLKLCNALISKILENAQKLKKWLVFNTVFNCNNCKKSTEIRISEFGRKLRKSKNPFIYHAHYYNFFLGMSSASSTSSSKCNNQNKIKKSPLSMFKHLSRSRMSNVSSSKEPPPAPPSIMVPSVPPSVAPSIVAESTCASPYPVMIPNNIFGF